MPAIGNFSAWVQVDSQKLTEYKVEYSQDGSKVTCWIPSEAGKKFEVCYQDSTRAIATGTSLTVDGTRCRGKILHERRNDNRRPKDTVTHRGLILSGNSIRPYFFSNCDLVENESDGLATNNSALGEIKLSVYEVLPGEYKSHNPRPGLPPLQIYERAKKGIVHGTQLGEPEKTHRQPCRSAARQRKLVSFVFKYRPIDVLIANDIAPPLRNATHSSSSRDVIDLTVDDEVECTTKNKTNRLRRRDTIVDAGRGSGVHCTYGSDAIGGGANNGDAVWSAYTTPITGFTTGRDYGQNAHLLDSGIWRATERT